jgi:hypothetical protein
LKKPTRPPKSLEVYPGPIGKVLVYLSFKTGIFPFRLTHYMSVIVTKDIRLDNFPAKKFGITIRVIGNIPD